MLDVLPIEIEFICPDCKKPFTVECEVKDVPDLMAQSGERKCEECNSSFGSNVRVEPVWWGYIARSGGIVHVTDPNDWQAVGGHNEGTLELFEREIISLKEKVAELEAEIHRIKFPLD